MTTIGEIKTSQSIINNLLIGFLIEFTTIGILGAESYEPNAVFLLYSK